MSIYRKVSDSELNRRDVTALRFMASDGFFTRPMLVRRRKAGEMLIAKDGGQIDDIPNGIGIQATYLTKEFYKEHPITDVILDHFALQNVIRIRYRFLPGENKMKFSPLQMLARQQRND